MNRTANIIIAAVLVAIIWGVYYFLLDSFQEKMDNQVTYLERAHTKIDSIEKDLENTINNNPPPALNAAGDKTTQDLNSINPEIVKYHNQANDAKHRLMLMKEEIGRLKEEIRRDRALKSENEIILRDQTSRLEQELENSRENIISLKQDKQELILAQTRLEINNRALKNEVKQLKERPAPTDSGTKEKTDAIGQSGLMELKGKIKFQEKRLNRISALYANLKKQLKELAMLLSEKDDKLSEKTRTIDDLKSQIAYVSVKFGELQESLNESEKKRKLLAEQLASMVNINKSFQEHLAQASGYLNEQNIKKNISEIIDLTDSVTLEETNDGRQEENYSDKMRAEKLKKTIDVILETPDLQQ